MNVVRIIMSSFLMVLFGVLAAQETNTIASYLMIFSSGMFGIYTGICLCKLIKYY